MQTPWNSLPANSWWWPTPPPKPIKQDQPNYPYWMAKAGLCGEVTVEFIIDRTGQVRNPFVVGSNNPWFEPLAVDAILGWKFQPGEKNGKPVNIRAEQRIVFDLDGLKGPPDIWRITKAKDHSKLPPELQWDTPPTPTRTTFPAYPFEQLQAGTVGHATVSYLVGPDGRVQGAKLREATAPEFGLAVLAMIDVWRFTPPKKKDGTPCYATLGAEYKFLPRGQGDVPVSERARWILSDLKKKPEAITKPKDLDRPLKPLSCRPPVYPTALEKDGQPGDAVIDFFVDQKGDAQLPRIVSSTAPEFGYAAVQAVATWRFEVPKKGGKPTVVRARIPVAFSIESAGNPGQNP